MEAVYKDNENIRTNQRSAFKVTKVFRGLYTVYGVIIFAILFFLFFPLLMIPIVFKKQFHLTGIFNRWWARLIFALMGLPWKVIYKTKLKNGQQYIFCPNHFSYLDIVIMGLNTHNTIFVGKSAMERIPFFGFMYRSLHITVDREKLKSRYATMIKSLQALDEGKSLVIFPEGGIITEKDPIMSKFKDGAFRASIEKQIPIVPVTIPYNWIILPPDEFLLKWKPMKLIFHDPIYPNGYTLDDIGEMKDKVKAVIQAELDRHLK
jgi:1-acyl-sn-glycerol-3-phosphate acyltransferase